MPEGFRERMEAAGVLSYRVAVLRVRRGRRLRAAARTIRRSRSPRAGSHDLATLRGWWEGHDIDLKSRHGLYPSDDEERIQREQRAKERVALIRCARGAGLGDAEELEATGPFRPDLADAVHDFLARTRAGLAMVQLDDLTDETDQVNLPGTSDEHPNWRRKQSHRRWKSSRRDPRVRRSRHILNERASACLDRKSPDVR